MRNLKTFSQLFESISRPRYKKPEFEIKEFYRAFKKNLPLRGMLPDDIDQEIFKVRGGGFKGEPKWMEKHLDPPGKSGEYFGTPELIEIAESKDPRFVPFILWCQELFESGKMEKISLEELRSGLRTKFKNHEWHDLEKDPDLLDKCKAEYEKAIEAGLDKDRLTNEKGLVQKYPGVDIPKAMSWAGYFGDSINYFDSVADSGAELPVTQFILHNGIYYTIGGRRRMFWHFYHKLDPTVWVINL